MSSTQGRNSTYTAYCGCQQKDSPQTKMSNFQTNFPNNMIISVEWQTEGNKNKEREWALKVTKRKQQMVLHNWQKREK